MGSLQKLLTQIVTNHCSKCKNSTSIMSYGPLAQRKYLLMAKVESGSLLCYIFPHLGVAEGMYCRLYSEMIGRKRIKQSVVTKKKKHAEKNKNKHPWWTQIILIMDLDCVKIMNKWIITNIWPMTKPLYVMLLKFLVLSSQHAVGVCAKSFSKLQKKAIVALISKNARNLYHGRN